MLGRCVQLQKHQSLPYVSKPYRYARKLDMLKALLREMQVSKPYRYARKNKNNRKKEWFFKVSKPYRYARKLLHQ